MSRSEVMVAQWVYVEVVVRRLQDKSHGPARMVQRSLETLQHISDDIPEGNLRQPEARGVCMGRATVCYGCQCLVVQSRKCSSLD